MQMLTLTKPSATAYEICRGRPIWGGLAGSWTGGAADLEDALEVERRQFPGGMAHAAEEDTCVG
jgi:hypothetical protein